MTETMTSFLLSSDFQMKKPDFWLDSFQYPKLYFFRILIHKFIMYDTEWVGSSEMNPILLRISLWDINSTCNFLQASFTAVVADILLAGFHEEGLLVIFVRLKCSCVREMKSLRYNVLVQCVKLKLWWNGYMCFFLQIYATYELMLHADRQRWRNNR